MPMFTDEGLATLKIFEGKKLTTYRDTAGLLTIGYGHRVTDDDDIDEGDTITEDQASDLLVHDLNSAEAIVKKHITYPMNDNQYSACVCFAFNAGSAPFIGLFAKLLNSGNIEETANDFEHWDHVRLRGALVEDPGLKRRCDAERDLFLKEVA